MHLPQITSSIDNSTLQGGDSIYDASKVLQFQSTDTVNKFLLLTIKSIKNIADPQKYGHQIISDILHLNKVHPQHHINDLQLIVEKIETNYQQAFHIQLQLVSISTKDSKHSLIVVSNQPTHFYFLHNHKLIKIPVSKQGTSGFLNNSDQLLIASSEFYSNISTDQLVEISQQSHLGLNILTSDTYTSCMLGIKTQKDLTSPQLGQKKPSNKRSLSSIFANISQRRSLNKKSIGSRRKFALVISIVFFMLLSASLLVGYQKRQALEQERIKTQLTEDINYRLQQAESLKNLNSLRAKTLLREAKTILNQYQSEHNDLDIQLLTEQVNHAYATVARQYISTNPEVFFDLNLIKEGFIANAASLAQDSMVLLDKASQTLVHINIDKKSSEIVAGRDVIPSIAILSSIEEWAFLISGNKLQIIDIQEKQQLNSFTLSTVQVDQLVGYGGNAYILDKNIGQLWRFRGTKSGLNKPDRFFKEDQDLSHVGHVAIDGSVWFLRNDGGIEKYTSGIKDAYYPKIELDLPISTPNAFASPENSNFLYILDSDNHRVLVVTKQAQYQSQYVWEQIDNNTQMIIAESIGKLLLVKDDKIYGIELEDQ